MDPGGRDRDDDIISLATETLCPTTSPFAQALIYSFLAPLLFFHFLSFLYHNPSTHLRECSSPSLDASPFIFHSTSLCSLHLNTALTVRVINTFHKIFHGFLTTRDVDV